MSNILVVDDDVDICALVAFKLERLGHDVTIEYDGEAGLAAAFAECPDLILVDWMMPRLTGLEMCRLLREGPGTGELPVILLTARAQEADVEKGFAAGADDYMVKPFSPRELVTRVNGLLERNARRAG